MPTHVEGRTGCRNKGSENRADWNLRHVGLEYDLRRKAIDLRGPSPPCRIRIRVDVLSGIQSS